MSKYTLPNGTVITVDDNNPPAPKGDKLAALQETVKDSPFLPLAGGTMTGAINEAVSTPIASATTINLDATTGNIVHITGTTPIEAVTLAAGKRRVLIFDSPLTLKYNASSNNLPTATDISVAAGDRAIYISDGAKVFCTNYQRADGQALAASAAVGGYQPGDVIYRASNTVPAGFIKANGALVSRTTYASLFTAIGTTYGAGDGSTTFALPDGRAYFPRGFDDGRGIDSGRVFGSTQDDQNLAHTHTLPYFNDTSTSIAACTYHTNIVGYGSATGSSGGTEARPKNIAWLCCIKY